MDEILEGAYDLHVHAGPSTMKRKYDVLEAMRMADHAAMKGLLFLDHSTPTAGLASLANSLDHRVKAFGAIMLNETVGGLNPAAVESALQMGVRMVQMPTYSAMGHIQKYGHDKNLFSHLISETKQGIQILDANGSVISAVQEILKLVADYDCMLATGHLSAEEIRSLVVLAKDMGIKRIMVTSVSTDIVDLPLDLQLQLKSMGAYFEHNYLAMTELPHKTLSVTEMVRQIKAIGAERCILATDMGQVNSPDLITAFNHFIEILVDNGVTMAEINAMIRENPAFLLGVA